jgi:hypothetical protein
MDPRCEHDRLMTRRTFFRAGGTGIGIAALATLLGEDLWAQQTGSEAIGGLAGLPHFAPKAKRLIYLFMPGAPSHIDLFDYKPKLKDLSGTELPESVRQGQRLTGMTASQSTLPIIASKYSFAQYGQAGMWLSELLPYTAKAADDICFVKSIWSEQINHDPGQTFMMTGFHLPGRPSIGSWVSYALGSENRDLPAFVAMVSIGKGGSGAPILERQWGSGFLPTQYAGVKFRSAADPVLYLSNPEGLEGEKRRRFLDDLAALNQITQKESGDPEIATRIAQYEMAARMQTSVPELTDLSKEPQSTFDLYGRDARTPGTFAANCLLARRLAERGVRFVMVAHRGWDQHDNLPIALPFQAKDIDQPSAALVQDLKQRGMLDDTLVVWGGEFGRTVYGQFGFSGIREETSTSYGRDHHPKCFTVWMAGGGVKPAITYGETDDFSYNITRDPVHIHDLQATLMHCMGIDHTRLTYRYQGRNFRLTDVSGNVVKNILA